ncbi:alpha-L-fucosidase [Luteolibacter pohnpeiensis]|uniref:alpha-L-fucosidase n=1 Tax=Luteolibacter pohnpeiensis TaxID=454153 RepID=A0A934VXN9_9BACT|nr:alpha-L-fucosidase [Luteolibacter pohnpeiensis]MBK1884048.1 alpha-L-fucosidase [Luteolibacter pohnpeiensis]
MSVHAQPSSQAVRPLSELQQEFVDLRFGMFIHFNIPTYQPSDWADPEASPELFNPKRLDCNQWAEAALSAKMSYGCLTTKHHSGFCIWDTKTTDYGVMSSPYKHDVVKEYTDAFRAKGLKTMLYYSILDTHHKIRPGHITPAHIEMIKQQITELLTNYGEISALVIDGWDAPWSRISYDDVPFQEIYQLVKKLQPNCVVMDLNAAKYPPDALFYGDIKPYEQNAGQHISKETNRLPAMSCLPLNAAWFWEPSFPNDPVKDPEKLVKDNLVPFNDAYCNFMLNVSPNSDGLLDKNALAALKKIGSLWKPKRTESKLPPVAAPIISSNLAKNKPADSSWSDDMWIMDFANDDDFGTPWRSNPSVEKPWLEIDLGSGVEFNTITFFEPEHRIERYKLQVFADGAWKSIPMTPVEKQGRLTIHRFERMKGDKVRISIEKFSAPPAIAEFGVYNEPR